MLKGLHPNIEVAQPWPGDMRAKVSACLVSRGPIDPQIMKSLEGFDEVIVGSGDKVVFGRFEAMQQAKNDLVYTQDDDCVVDVPAVLNAFDGRFTSNLLANRMGEYGHPDRITLIGWGSIFDRRLVQPAFDIYLKEFPADHFFWRVADRIFTGLTPDKKIIHVDVENLPRATDGDRMYRQTKHWEDLAEIFRRTDALRAKYLGR